MKNKIFCILICTLVIATFTAAAETNLNKNSKTSQYFDDEVPIWETGYSWSYTGEIDLGDDTIPLYLNINEMDLQITADSVEYKAIFGGDIDGEFIVQPDIPLSIVIEELNGIITFSKGNIGINSVDIFINGKPKLGSTVLPIPAQATISIDFTPPYAMIDFPIFVGKTWTVPTSNVDGEIYFDVLGIFEQTIPFNEDIGDVSFECVSKENITLGGSTYYSYKVEPIGGEGAGFYYCADVGNIALLEYEPGTPVVELLATNYPTPNNPLKPDTPTGPLTGGINQLYTYQTKTIDPDGDQIKYGWDFDGDSFVDVWTGLYDSDITIDTDFTWTEPGSYQIKVKARDTTNKDSAWSDPLSVTMPKARTFQRPLLRFLENHPRIFPILRNFILK